MGISVGLVGLGAFGSEFVEFYGAHPLVDRVALCDRDGEKIAKFAENPVLAKKFTPSDAYSSLDELLRSDVEAVVIITQPWLHAAQAVQAMEAGKHVYSAVPVVMLPDSDEILGWCDRIVETCRRTGMRYMLGETTYYKPGTMYCRSKAAEGAFGKFVLVEAEYIHDVDSIGCSLRNVQKWRESGPAGREWHAIAEAYLARGARGGPMHYPTHSTSAGVSIMKAHAVKVAAFGYPAPEGDEFFKYDAFANETALFEMSNGAHMRIAEYRYAGVWDRETFSVYGTGGGLSVREHRSESDYWSDRSGLTRLSQEEMRDALPEDVHKAFAATTHGPYGGHSGSHAFLVHEFVSSVAEDRQPATNAWEAVRYMAPGAVAHKSALRGGERLDVPDWGDAPEK